MSVKLLTENHLEFLSLKGGCRGFPESTIVKMSNCWKSHATAQLMLPMRLYKGNKCFIENIDSVANAYHATPGFNIFCKLFWLLRLAS